MSDSYTEAIRKAAELDSYLDPNEASKISDEHGCGFLAALQDIKYYRRSLNKGDDK